MPIRPFRALLFRVLALGLGAFLLELASCVVLSVRDGEVPTPSRLEARRRAVQVSTPAADDDDRGSLEVIHPFLGFVYDPAADTPELRALHGAPISRFGFLDERDPIVAGRPDRVVVGLFGGSFAAWTWRDARQQLLERLRRSPRFAGKEIVLVNTALGGFKQPQQLATLAYLLALGGHFDLVVNLDGFNEVALPVIENLPKGVFLPYPRNWYLRTTEVLPGPVLRLVARADSLRRLRVLAARLASAPLLGSSPTAQLVWRGLDRLLMGKLGEAEKRLVGIKVDDRRFLTTGPFTPFADRAVMLASLASVWRDSSLQMDCLARANGARYLHFLQPNQYVKGSKPLSEEELARAVDKRSPYASAVRRGYPHLIAAGRELRRAGVEFHDLTRLFADRHETLYRDTCCHVNPRGSELVADAIADAILAGR